MSTLGAQATAVISGSFLSGAMLSVSLVSVPVLLSTATTPVHLFQQWTRVYYQGHIMAPTMALATCLIYSYAALKRRSTQQAWGIFALAGLTTLSIAPFTWVFMVPTNNELFRLEGLGKAGGLKMGLEEAKELVSKWSRLHVVRSLLPLAGVVMGAMGTFGKSV